MRRMTRDIITGACLLRWIVRDIIAGAAVVFPRNFHRAVLSSKKVFFFFFFFFFCTNQCTKKSRLYSLEKALSAYLSMQYKNRSRSPIRSLSLAVVVLHCSLHGFNSLLYRIETCKSSPKLLKTPISCSEARAGDQTLTPLLYFPAGDQTLTP